MIAAVLRGLTSRISVQAGRGPAHMLALVVAAAATVCVLVAFGGAYGSLDRRARDNRNTDSDYRLLAAAYATDLSRDFVRAARDLVPAAATFDVETGDKVHASTPVSIYAARGYSQYQLFPRRLVTPDKADWLLCYGCDTALYAKRFQLVWSGEEGVSILKAHT